LSSNDGAHGGTGDTYGGARIVEASVDSGVFPSAQPYTVLAFLYIVLIAVLFYGWMFVFFRLVGVSLPYFLRAGKMGLPHALDRERRDPRAPVTVLRSFNDEAAGGETTYPKLEAAVEEAASVYGPAVTAGLHGQLPAGGVARLYLSDATWKDGPKLYRPQSVCSFDSRHHGGPAVGDRPHRGGGSCRKTDPCAVCRHSTSLCDSAV
jgi:hypothetical protein